MKTVRQQVLDYVRAHQVVSAADLARAMQMTEANARRHFALLEAQGLVEVVGRKAAEGRGRKALLYGPSLLVLGHNLDRLAGALLNEILPGLSEAGREDLLKKLALRVVEGERGSGNPPEARGSLTTRLYQAVRSLNARHYAARWEARAEGPHLILNHCPYAAIIERYPELCQMDAHLLENLLGAPVAQLTKLAKDPRGAASCTFCVRVNR